MKLKERVAMLLALTVTFSLMYIVAIQFSWTEVEATAAPTVSGAVSLRLTLGTNPGRHSVPEASAAVASLKQESRAPVNHSNSSVSRLKVSAEVASRDAWTIWKDWVQPDFLYPEHSFYSMEMNHILSSMATAPITSFGVGHKGTQLKATAMLADQRTVFKPKRYECS